MFGSIRRALGFDSVVAAASAVARRSWLGQRIAAKYDAAQSTKENQKHWANADRLSANAAHSPAVRAALRSRSRYECQNNSYLAGLVSTMANDLVGTGPRLQLRIPNNSDAATLITKRFAKWAKSIGFADKLRVMHESRIRDGECFGAFSSNPQLVGVQLDLRPVEADQVTSAGPILNPLEVDGIVHDQFGNVISYTMMNHHPGSNIAMPWEFMTVPAPRVVHWFRPSRPGQARGVPELTAALPLCAQLRRYTLATLTSAETAAMLAGIMKTNLPPGDGQPVSIAAMDEIELVRGALLTLPAGWDTAQFKAEQPTGTFREFKNEILNEMARCVSVPFNVMAGNSSGYNYSSGRLDHLVYYRVVWIERGRMEQRVLDRLFSAWLYEAMLIPGYLPANLPPFVDWETTWQWDGVESIDPQKDAQATQLEMSLGLTTLAEEAAARGRDWREVLNQLAIEQAEAKRLGVDWINAAAAVSGSPSPPDAQPTQQAGVTPNAAA